MAFTSSTRLVNPRLGTYFGIFAATFAGLVLMALMFEQLGVADGMLRLVMFAGPLLLYAAIGICANAKEMHDFFVSGRRVPAFFNGLVLAVSALGGAAFLALTGALFVIGFDALCLTIGLYAGLVFMGVLFAPFLRKFGAYTVPTFLGRRFDNRIVRIAAAAILSVPILLLLGAEARFAAYASAWMLGQSERLMALVVVAYATVVVVAGGMRSLTWSSVAKAIAALLALAVPATIVALMVSNLPLPQMTHGNVLRILTRLEIIRGVPIVLSPPMTLELPGAGVEPLIKRFIQAFGSVGSFSFVCMCFVVAAGVAGCPSLVARAGTTPGVYEARKSHGWAVLIAGVVLLTLPAVAVYLRAVCIEQIVGQSSDRLPAWFELMQHAGIARIDTVGTVGFGNIGFERDAVLFALPIAAGLPQVLIYLALAGALAASLAALSASLMAAAAIVAEDVVHGLPNEMVPERVRINTARAGLVGAAFVTLGLAVSAADPLQLFLWSLTFSAAVSFPILFLAIWWERMNAWGALAGMVAGFVVTALIILLCETGAVPLASPLAGAFGLPCALLAILIVSLATPVPARNALGVVRDMRVPGGETIYDREIRLLRLKSRAPT